MAAPSLCSTTLVVVHAVGFPFPLLGFRPPPAGDWHQPGAAAMLTILPVQVSNRAATTASRPWKATRPDNIARYDRPDSRSSLSTC